MSIIKIDYDKLNVISKSASSASSKMQDYIDDLSKKVSCKYAGIPGGSSLKINNSEYYVNCKINHLKKKKTYYLAFSDSVSTFLDNAKEIDKEVAKTIKASKDKFIDKHDYIDVNWWTELKEHFINLKNSCPLFDSIGKLIDQAVDGLRNMWADLKYWYRCGGGKEQVGVVLAAAGAIASVVIAICAWCPPISGIVAVCAAIGATLTAINAIVNIFTSVEAMNAKNRGDPAWAKIYGEQDTVQDVFRQRNWHNATLNRLSYDFALGFDVAQTVCDFVAIYDGIKNIKNVYKEIKLSSQKGKVSFGTRLKQYLFNSDHYTSTQSDSVKWREILQKRGKIATLREYGVTKAISIDQYNRSLTSTQKLAMKVTKYATYGKKTVTYTQKVLDYTLGGDWSIKNTFKDVWSEANGKFKTTDVINKFYNLKDKNWKSFNYDFKGMSGLNGFAG